MSRTGPVVWADVSPFPEAAADQLANTQQRETLSRVTHQIRQKRARVVEERDDWQELRQAAEQIKNRTLRHLDTYLEQAEQALTRAGATVHWAVDADHANRIIHALIKDTGETEVVKVKSMATAEIGLNEYLQKRGITATETDLAELIVQLADGYNAVIERECDARGWAYVDVNGAFKALPWAAAVALTLLHATD